MILSVAAARGTRRPSWPRTLKLAGNAGKPGPPGQAGDLRANDAVGWPGPRAEWAGHGTVCERRPIERAI